MSAGPLFLETTPHAWEVAKLIGKKLNPYVFRGHASCTWPLKTAMERALEQQQKELVDQAGFEWLILERFKSRAHHFISSPPNDNERIEWLALIQDYGGPTRLLDFTESFYIASFFAAEMAVEDACVWAINRTALYVREIEKTAVFEEKVAGPYPKYHSSIRLAEYFMDNVHIQICPNFYWQSSLLG